MKKFALLSLVLVFFCAFSFAQQQAPAETSAPAATPVKATADKPAATEKPAVAEKPAAAEKPAVAEKPAEVSMVIPKGAKVFIAEMPNNFHEFIKEAIDKKQVPVTVVTDKAQAEFEITGFSESQKASAAKIIIMGSWHSRETASIKVTNLQSGVVAFAYSYNTDNSARGKKSSSESCAKHLKEKIESGK